MKRMPKEYLELAAWRAGGVDALRFDYSKVVRKRKG